MNGALETRMGMNKIHGLSIVGLALSVSAGCTRSDSFLSSRSSPAPPAATATPLGGDAFAQRFFFDGVFFFTLASALLVPELFARTNSSVSPWARTT
jgi:hypothetical protein